DALIASGFNRAHITTNEGGSIEEEVYCRNVFDRVETFGQVFLGLTLTCARCHDHKFDPVTQKEYYGLFAYFNSLDGKELDGNKKDPEPVAKVPSPAQAKELARLREAAEKVQARMDGPEPGLDAKQEAWEKDLAERLAKQWTVLDAYGFRVSADAAMKELDDQSVQPGELELAYEATLRVEGEGLQALRLEVLPPEPPGEGPLPFAVTEIEADQGGERIRFLAGAEPEAKGALDGKRDTAWTGDARKKPSIVLLAQAPFGRKEPADLRVRLIQTGAHARQPAPRFRVSATRDGDLLKGARPIVRGPWHLLGSFAAADGDVAFKTEYGPEKGVDLAKPVGDKRWERREDILDGKDGAYPAGVGASYAYRTFTVPTPRSMTFSIYSDDAVQVWLNGAVVLSRNVKRTFRRYDANKVALELEPGENRLLVKFANYGTTRDHKFNFDVVEEEGPDLLRDAAEALAVEAAKRTDAQRAMLRTRFRRERWPEWRSLARQRAVLRGQEKVLLDQVPTTLVFRERETPREAFVLERGEYDHRKDKVGRGVPAALPAPPPGAPANRLGLAQWLLDPKHPLTARVAVNRFWQQVFGTGLVKTSEDFGLQGEPPSHPELLDHLAARFIEDGWDVKAFMRRLVMSSTYRQSSRSTPELIRRDPENRLLARGPRFRLDAETVRDQILWLSGLLVEEVGGPSVKPPQPEGLWEAVGYTGSNTYRFQRDPEPQKVFRRSLYIFWKRTSAPPQMTLFDAPSRESCVARRERTNTPLQALFLMNEPQCFEAARHLAQKALKEGGATPESRAAWMLRRCTARAPAEEEVATLVSAYRAQRAIYEKDPEGAKKAIAVGDVAPDPAADPVELAAWTMTASVVLNLDEVLTKN
ncbi:MAG TPA: DUF1553 domain-containing protein, partial [Planctomycetota bacterium]|nr:DUF1553 domain-containing protein [Planctomycetota bacterium]